MYCGPIEVPISIITYFGLRWIPDTANYRCSAVRNLPRNVTGINISRIAKALPQ
jgi:hypothetical protein